MKSKKIKYLAPYVIGAFTWGNVTHSYLHNHTVPLIVFSLLFAAGAVLFMIVKDEECGD